MCIRDRYESGLQYVASDTICFPAKLVHGHVLDLSKPVSYTHLDVYKRQAYALPPGGVTGHALKCKKFFLSGALYFHAAEC